MPDSPGGRRIRRAPARPLHGRTAVVTGAARGIGEALAHSLSHAGMRVALLGQGKSGPGEDGRVPPRSEHLCRVRRHRPHGARGGRTPRGGRTRARRSRRGQRRHRGERPVRPYLRRTVATRHRRQPHRLRQHGPRLPAPAHRHPRVLPPDRLDRRVRLGTHDECVLRLQSRSGVVRPRPARRGRTGRGQVGIAYLHWTGTDMLTGIDDHPVLAALRRNQPRPPAGSTPPPRSPDG